MCPTSVRSETGGQIEGNGRGGREREDVGYVHTRTYACVWEGKGVHLT